MARPRFIWRTTVKRARICKLCIVSPPPNWTSTPCRDAYRESEIMRPSSTSRRCRSVPSIAWHSDTQSSSMASRPARSAASMASRLGSREMTVPIPASASVEMPRWIWLRLNLSDRPRLTSVRSLASALRYTVWGLCRNAVVILSVAGVIRK